MKLLGLFLVLGLLCACHINVRANEQYEDNEFAEFENFDEEDTDFVKADEEVEPQKPYQKPEAIPEKSSKVSDDFDDDGVVEDEDNEFEHFQDEEEFEGFDQSELKDTPELNIPKTEPKLTVAKLPLHFRTHWDSYWMEMLLLAGLTTYFANFFMGKSKNSRLANLWLTTHKQLLEENFVLIGDDGKLENENPGLNKESESVYTLWCSGRTCVEGMLVELKMIKRQDLVSLLAGFMRPTQDQVFIRCEISKDSMDSFIFSVGTKKTISKFYKEYNDLARFCTLVTKPEERYNVPNGFSILSEIPEATSSMLEPRIITALNKYQDLIDYIHISDQFSGAIQTQDEANASSLKQPEIKRILHVGFNMPKNCDMEQMKPLLVLVFYILEKLKRYRLSRESKNKADKNRQKVQEEFLKSTHAARAEAAAVRREEKRKQEKEKVLAEEDPEKQRRWELKEQKRQAKKKAPKMKRLAIKSL